MCVKSLLKMRITDSDSPEILYSSSANYVVYTMKSPKSNLVNLCNDREHKHSVKQGKYFGGRTQYIVTFVRRCDTTCSMVIVKQQSQ